MTNIGKLEGDTFGSRRRQAEESRSATSAFAQKQRDRAQAVLDGYTPEQVEKHRRLGQVREDAAQLGQAAFVLQKRGKERLGLQVRREHLLALAERDALQEELERTTGGVWGVQALGDAILRYDRIMIEG
jgi:hypothetical protein